MIFEWVYPAHIVVSQGRTWALLFNYFVGTREHCGRNFEAERLGGLEIDDQLEPGRLLDRQGRPVWRL